MTSMKSRARRMSIRMSLAMILIGLSPSMAQVNIEAYRDYFLVGRFGEVCTMCEVVVLCQAGDERPSDEGVPGQGDFTLYHLQTRTFWSQVSTIWEWFISNFSSASLAARGHTRPIYVYRIGGGAWSGPEVIEGRLILEPAVLEFDEFNIDRIERVWRLADTGEPVGYCSRLPLWESLESIEANAPGGAS